LKWLELVDPYDLRLMTVTTGRRCIKGCISSSCACTMPPQRTPGSLEIRFTENRHRGVFVHAHHAHHAMHATHTADAAHAGTGAPRRAAPLTACAAGVLLASGLPMELAGSVSTAAAIAAGLATTLVLVALWRLTFRVRRLEPARRILVVFSVLSLFGWSSALVTLAPPVAHWLGTAPVGLAFLLVNGLKLISVVPLP
jgi:putative flippase GtrA